MSSISYSVVDRPPPTQCNVVTRFGRPIAAILAAEHIEGTGAGLRTIDGGALLKNFGKFEEIPLPF
jgi:hypothetical protein